MTERQGLSTPLPAVGNRAVLTTPTGTQSMSELGRRRLIMVMLNVVTYLLLMWGVAYADGRLGDIERHTMWRIADLLHIPQGAYVHARMRAKAAAGIGDED